MEEENQFLQLVVSPAPSLTTPHTKHNLNLVLKNTGLEMEDIERVFKSPPLDEG